MNVDDMKVLECFQSMHQYLAFQTRTTSLPIMEQEKLVKITQFCEGLKPSLQFREDLINTMALNMHQAQEQCQYALNQTRNDTVLNQWWWDDKRINTDSINCQTLIADIKEEQEYGIVTNVATDLSLAQMENEVTAVCNEFTVQVFKRQCSKRILDAGILFLFEDDQLEQQCNQMSSAIETCEQSGPNLINRYYEIVLKKYLEEYGKLTVNNYFDDALLKIQNTMKKQLEVKPQQQNQDSNSIVNPSNQQSESQEQSNQPSQQEKSESNTDSTNQASGDQSSKLAQKNQQTESVIISNQSDNFAGYDENDDEEFNSVPLDIPI
ncbi:UNKNOWN [Stylonychia lemnae]|uniref:Uncharacterized protein n=1 Tax=Stylonychia lemnae TaxID=5949 RepID=A0A078AH91_STYLE|nr:UNKNOWN [Stylonychia lemnae]|eukprot:CDW81655.1 UNKNOWN [Stylonychia lemnae]